ncbi:MBL fold metallo-hydrolase [Pararhizobium sp.]|uniref:MBL fold metallo-hydrolase n=1 Tax=Pararhizobium sp. TaxID=1977563 RepID=UPI00271E6AA0|nr:MBL fold metallo-hydrolase [Pararhizobium sp.]MDO9415130.1 MBL fold metallo-hydrolase [Pararhizobium sp.]
MRRSFAVFALSLVSVFSVGSPASAQNVQASQCQAIAEALPGATFASFGGASLLPVQASAQEVRITYLGHSTFHLETPGGISIATDYNGWYTPPQLPDVVTMNKAHSTHYTMTPDPGIKQVLQGWNPEGGPADHDVVVGDAYIRNVTTDIRSGYGAMEPDANSIFIFEVAGLCIGHLGHLHHTLTDKHYAEIGRLDVVMVPVDGGLTMGAQGMSEVVTRLRSALILPMHRRGPPITAFLQLFDTSFDVVFSPDTSITVSLASLPRKPTIHILSGV